MLKTLLTTLLVMTVALSVVLVDFETAKANPIFSDNFNDGMADGWTQQAGSWKVINGEYYVSVGIVENGISTVDPLSLADCTIETQLRFTDSVGFRAGIVFRYTDNQHYYSLELSNEYDKVELFKYSLADPNYAELLKPTYGKNEITINTNVIYQLRLEVAGSNFNAYLNGQKVLSGTDSSYSAGLVGLRARRADACFDNFKVEKATVPLPTPAPTPSPAPIPNQPFAPFSDDFSKDSGSWQYFGSAYRDATNQTMVLTTSINQNAGVALFNAPIHGSFTASFRYKAGGGGWQGDGFTMFFYKQKYTSVNRDYSGNHLGFNSFSTVPGYGIEFDGWQNIPWDFQQITGGQPNPQSDPSANHIALIKDFTGNHLAYVDDQRVADNNWHRVSVEVQATSVKVYVDQDLVLKWSGILDRTYDGFGFSGATGGVGSNWHIIDDFSITAQNLKTPSLTTSCTTAMSQSSFNVKINGYLTFSGAGIPDAPVLLSYSVTGGESWQDLTLVHTSQDGGYSALWLLSVTGDYMLKAVYRGSENYLGASNIVNFAMEPCTEQSVFSVTSNSTLSKLSFNSANKELSFSASGDSGSTGYVNVYIPKSLVGDISGLKVFLDSNQIDYNTQPQSEGWLIYLTYQHSNHVVKISLGSSSPTGMTPTTSPTNTPWLDWVQIAISALMGIIVAIVAIAAVKFLRKPSQKQ